VLSVTDSDTDGISFNLDLHICNASTNSKLIIPATVSPMFFELLALALMYWNTLDRPRAQDTSLRAALMKDGLSFFLVCHATRR
jgi:hypothetical protein